MSVFGSLFTAVSGLSAQSQSISMISNNIANVTTVGYKRTDAEFSSLVTGVGRSTTYSPGSVSAVQNARISQQGILQQSSSPTDIAVSGNGFFIVKSSSTDPLAEPVYTRAGSFSEDSSGVLRNAAGFYLQGWPLDQNGNLPASQADISSLVPVDVGLVGGLTQPTSTASLAMNLKAGETQAVYPGGVAPGYTADFTRGIKVFDSLGAGHDLTVTFKKMTSPTATAIGAVTAADLSAITGNVDATAPFAAGESFSIKVGAGAAAGEGPLTNISLAGDVASILSQINSIVDINGAQVAFAQLDPNGHLSIKATNTGKNITLANVSGTPLAANKLGLTGSPYAAPTAPNLLTATPYTPNTEGWWTVAFSTPSGATVSTGVINFRGNGQLNATKDLQGQVLLGLNDIDWSNGSNLQDIDFDIGGISQFSGEYNVVSSSQNGAELGLRTGVSIDDEGFVIAQFSNGQSSKLYKLAIATFANANGLAEVTGNVFRESDSSGSFNLREAGKGSAGKIASGALEGSNVDLADEFSKMIVTQRAYSANTKVISTADQMTQELLQLR